MVAAYAFETGHKRCKKGSLMSAQIFRTMAYLLLLGLMIYVAVQGAV